jgi:hypothetical protein
MTMLDDVAAFLIANTTTFTIAGTTAGDLSIEQALDSMPDTLVTLYEQPGLGNAYAFSTSTSHADVVYERPNLQAISRSTSPTVARSNIKTVYTQLDGLTDTTMTATRYLEFEAVQAPFQLGRDDNERWLWSLNFNVKKEVS